MVYVQLTNGFGNNLFQYNAARLLATFLEQDVIAIPPHKDYYGIGEFKQIGIDLQSVKIPKCEKVNDLNYTHFFNKKFSDSNLLVSGYFENYKIPRNLIHQSQFSLIKRRFGKY